MEDDLKGWRNGETRNLWSWLVSSRDRVPVLLHLKGLPQVGSGETQILDYIRKCLFQINPHGPKEISLIENIQLVDWTQIVLELRKIYE